MNYFLSALKKYAVFEGRARRAEYWFFSLFCGIISIILMIIESSFMKSSSPGDGVLDTIFRLAILLPSIAVGVRRMHDVNRSGWYILIPIYSFILSVTEGDHGDNRYGSNPKSHEDTTTKDSQDVLW